MESLKIPHTDPLHLSTVFQEWKKVERAHDKNVVCDGRSRIQFDRMLALNLKTIAGLFRDLRGGFTR
jgi:hypothetical protein